MRGSVIRTANIFGLTVDEARARYRRNAATLRWMAERAGDRRYRGKSREEWLAAAAEFESLAA